MSGPAKSKFRELFTQQTQLFDGEIELDRASLYLAGEEHPQLEVELYLKQLDDLADTVKDKSDGTTDPQILIESLNQHMFDSVGFRGNEQDYYHPDNCYLDIVLDTRTGMPITLSVVYLEVARRLDLPCHGVGLPGHFLVCLEALGLYLDPFSAGHLLSAADCRRLVRDMLGANVPWRDEFLLPYTKRDILYRMLNNLKGAFLERGDYARAISALERMAAINPAPQFLYKELSWCHLHLNQHRSAAQYLEIYLETGDPGEGNTELKRQMNMLWSVLKRLN